MKLLTTTEAINKAIESIARRGKQLDHDIQVTGVSCLAHVAEHGDTTILDKLVNAMPKGSRKTAFCEWALAYGNIRMLDRGNERDADAIAQGRLFAKDKTKDFNLEGAWENMWYDFKPEKDLLDTFDAAKMVAMMMKKFTQATRQGAKIEGTAEAEKQLNALMQALRTQNEKLDDVSETV